MAIATINPATGETLRIFEALSDAQIEEKIARAAELFPRFSRLPFGERATKMLARRGNSGGGEKRAGLR